MNQRLHRKIKEPGRSKSFGLLQAFLDNARSQPQSCAVIVEGRSWTYAEVADKAGITAQAILEALSTPPSKIGILGNRRVGGYIGILASLMVGAAFVPINPKLPAKLRRQIVETANLEVIIVSAECVGALEEPLSSLPALPLLVFPDTIPTGNHDFPGIYVRQLSELKPLATYPLVQESDIAYLLFTSGSTGDPKGVPISHGNICSFLASIQERYEFKASDRFTQNFELSFDLSLFDLFVAWQCGGTFCVPSESEKLSPFEFLGLNHVTVWFSVPSQAIQLLDSGLLAAESLPTLRLSLFCGEPLPVRLAAAWQAAAPNSRIDNLYGPTELTVACMAYRWRGKESLKQCYRELVPIGLPFRGLEVIVVDERLKEVAPGEIGELCVAGPQAFGGYWTNQVAPSNAFATHRSAGGLVTRYYRTGDLVSKQQGVFVFCGRRDDQIKINGYRIELGQVEAEMRAAGFPEAIALAWPNASNPQSILLVLSKGADTTRAHSEAKSRLPAYMVPTHTVLLDKIPSNLNGKIDRVAVRRLAETSLTASFARPLQKTISKLDRAIADALEIEAGSLSDALSLNSISNWDSLGHARLMMALEKFIGVDLPQAMMTQLNSIGAIRRYVANTCSPEFAAGVDTDGPVHRGLAGLFVENSGISQVDGKRGSLHYAGYSIDELCSRSTFEEVFWLLLEGRLPSKAELGNFSAKLASYRSLPANIIELLCAMRQAAPSVALRTAVSALSTSSRVRSTEIETGLRVTALIPCLIATHDALRRDAPVPQPDPELPHAADFARMLLGDKASPAAAAFMQRDLILHADHEANASTFTARIATGCGADLVGTITAAIAAFAGELHGGAVEAAARMFDEIGDPSNAVEYIRDRKRIMGFGHRVYQVEDPRVLHMRLAAASLAHAPADLLCLRIADALVEAMKPRAKFGIAPNVDLYASVAYRSLGIQDDLGTVLGVAGRAAGWVAHALEQRRDNVLVRPRFKYVGPPPRAYPTSRDD